MTLTELVTFLKKEYPQTIIEANVFDFEKVKNIRCMQPKYFFRGENKIYENARSTFHRMNIESKFNQSELLELCYTHHHLYLFLREAIFCVSIVEKADHGDPQVELSIAGLLRHYGFDTSFLDVTSDIHIAANFALCNSPGQNGRILVINSDTLNEEKTNYYFDLTTW
jgi:hypothetical protein